MNKPVDVLRLCEVTDEYFKSIKKYVLELEKENAELKDKTKRQSSNYRHDVDFLIRENAKLEQELFEVI